MQSLVRLAAVLALAALIQNLAVRFGAPISGPGFWAGIAFMLAISIALNSRPPAGEPL